MASLAHDVTVPFKCEACARSFSPQDGAKCRRCGKLLCRDHFVSFGAEPVCVYCRPINDNASSRQPSRVRRAIQSFFVALAGGAVGGVIGQSLGSAVVGAVVCEAIFLFLFWNANDRHHP